MDKWKKILPIILVFIIVFLLRVYWICQKNYVFHDSTTSFSVSTPNNLDQDGKPFKLFWNKFNFKLNYEYTGVELKKMMFATDGTLKSTIKDIKTIYLHKMDYGHSDLYFILFRAWNLDLQDMSFKNFIWHGCSFNLMVFCCSFFFMYKLLQLLIKDEKYIPIGLAIAFMSTGSISTTLLIREYQLQEFGFILTTFIFAKIYLWINEHKNLEIFSKKNFFLYSLGLAFFSLSGYYALIYEALLSLVLIFILFKNVKLSTKNCLNIFLFLICIIVIVFIIDPNFHYVLDSIYISVSITNFKTISEFYWLCLKDLNTFLISTVFYLAIFCLIVPLLFFTNFKKLTSHLNSLILLLFCCSLIWCLIIFLLTPFLEIRYILPAFPILSLIFIYFLQGVNFRFSLVFAFIFLVFAIFPNTMKVSNNNRSMIHPVIYYINSISYSILNNKFDLPMVFNTPQWTIVQMSFYMKDTQKVMFVDKIPTKSFKYKSFIYFEKGLTADDFEKISKAGNNQVFYSCSYLKDCYVIIDNNIRN